MQRQRWGTVGKRQEDAKTESDPHRVGKATRVSYCLMNKICRTNRVEPCAARRRHTVAKIAQSQTVESERARNLEIRNEREQTGKAESRVDEKKP